jgi:hypothetical protein
MKRQWELKPNLLDCILEDRISPAIANLGVIVLTTSGYSLVTPFPGASNSASGSLGSGGPSGGTAASVSGAAIPTSFYITGNRGISTFQPGNFTGNPNVGGGPAGAVSGTSVSIQIGSGADDASAPVAAPAAHVGYGGTTAPILAYIGQPSTGSDSPLLPAGDSYRAPTAPVPALPPLGVVLPGTPVFSPSSLTMPANPLNPQAGAPTLFPGMTPRMSPSLPGGLGVPGNSTAPGMYNN